LKLPSKAERIEMTDGRVYYSLDGWQTAFLVKAGKVRKLHDQALHFARFLAAAQSSAGPA
jgi:hypothetical protein